jgi:hypothetical protein
MATGDLSKQLLSASDRGRNVNIGRAASPGTLVHTAHPTSKDEVWLWACNTTSTDREIHIEFGAEVDTDDVTVVTIPGRCGWVPVVYGFLVTNSVTVRVWAEVADVINVNGFVNRID